MSSYWRDCKFCHDKRNTRSSSTTFVYTYNDHDDFCRPTKCPKCGAPVFFVRHNGGSVWFDRLGKPWPKHGCFDDNYTSFIPIVSFSSSLQSPLLGIVIK